MKRQVIFQVFLIAISLFLASRLSPNFLDLAYLLDTSTLFVEVGLLALAMTFVLISGNIDLSVGSMLALCSCIAAKLLHSGMSIWLVVPIVIFLGVKLGAINGLLVARLKVPSFLVTLGTMALNRGIAQAVMGPNSVKVPQELCGLDRLNWIGLPIPLIVFCAAAVVSAMLLHHTVFGRRVFALGTNERAAIYSAIPTDRIKIIVFSLSGLMAAVGGLMMDSRLGVARADIARGSELDAITIAVLGGAAVTGGKGTILGTVTALTFLMIVKTTMGVANVKPEYQLTAIGALLVLAVLGQRLGENLSKDKLRRVTS